LKAMGAPNIATNSDWRQIPVKTMTAILFLRAISRFTPRLCVSASLLVTTAVLLSAPTATFAGTATWDLNPGSGDWNTAGNWTPMTVPNASTDTATFGLSNTTNVSLSANSEVNGIIFDPGASAYTITASPGLTLTLSGAGIVNNSGVMENFVTKSNAIGVFEHIGQIFFTNGATAGHSTHFTNNGGTSFNILGGETQFFNNSSAGSGTFTNNAITSPEAAEGGTVEFHDSSTAANGTFTNNGGIGSPIHLNGGVFFFDNSTAANGIFINNGGSGAPGATVFFGGMVANGTFINNGAPTNSGVAGDTALQGNSGAVDGTFTNNGGLVAGASGGETRIFTTAGNGTFTNNGGLVSGAFGGKTIITAGTAANGTFTNNGGMVSGAFGGETVFTATPSGTAAKGTFMNNGGLVSGAFGGETIFEQNSSADSATLIANGGTGGGQGGAILFKDQSIGGTSRIEVFGNGKLDISFHTSLPHHPSLAVTIGSIEGDGNVFLGTNNLTVGSNNLSTAFSGVIQDGGDNGGSGGSLTKVGSGTLDLTGANTYTGNTNVSGGTLKVDGTVTNDTLVHQAGTLAGTGVVSGNVTNRGTVSPGDALGALTVNSYAQIGNGNLLINIAGPSPGQFGVLNVLGTANLSGLLNPVLLNGFIPSIGDEFTFLNYSSFSGTLKIRHPAFDNNMERWVVTYQANDAVLTATKNVPDHGSTFLLLTLGLFGLGVSKRLAAQAGLRFGH
jgi:autotransporter-associated beta strand protein